MKDKNGKKNIKRVAVDCIFREIHRRREFTSPGNFEAFNLMKNKLDKIGVVHQPGKLIFEFVLGEIPKDSSPLKREDIDPQICACGHNRFTHGSTKFYPYRGPCQVNGCRCREYKAKVK